MHVHDPKCQVVGRPWQAGSSNLEYRKWCRAQRSCYVSIGWEIWNCEGSDESFVSWISCLRMPLDFVGLYRQGPWFDQL